MRRCRSCWSSWTRSGTGSGGSGRAAGGVGRTGRVGGRWRPVRARVGGGAHRTGPQRRVRRDPRRTGLRAMPVTEKAFLSGDLGFAKVRLLVDLAKQLPDAYAEAEAVLVEQVQTVRVDQVPIVLARWRALVDTAGEEERAARDYAERSLHISPLLARRLAHRRQPHRRGRRDLPQRPRPPRPRDVPRRESRSRRQRRQSHVHRRATPPRRPPRAPPPSHRRRRRGQRRERPRHHRRHRRHQAHPTPSPPRSSARPKPAPPCPRATALRWCCDAGISRILTAPASTPIDLGHTARLPNRAQRRALAARDRGCTFPGCDKRAGWTSAHHLVHWIHGGPTSLWNQTLLCTFHHHRVHEGRFGLRRLPNGELEFTRPNGTTLTVPKRRWNDAA